MEFWDAFDVGDADRLEIRRLSGGTKGHIGEWRRYEKTLSRYIV